MSDLSTEITPVITVSRKFGAGGRSVAKELSQKLGIPWYDKDFVKKTAIDSGYSEEEILAEGEELSDPQRLLDSILNSTVSYTSSRDAIFLAQKEAMLELAKSPCIIVGRCANIILQEAGINPFKVFLTAPKDVRIQRTVNKESISHAEAEKMLTRIDAYREIYYKKYTGHSMSCADDYNICIDTGLVEYDRSADMLVNIITSKG